MAEEPTVEVTPSIQPETTIPAAASVVPPVQDHSHSEMIFFDSCLRIFADRIRNLERLLEAMYTANVWPAPVAPVAVSSSPSPPAAPLPPITASPPVTGPAALTPADVSHGIARIGADGTAYNVDGQPVKRSNGARLFPP